MPSIQSTTETNAYKHTLLVCTVIKIGGSKMILSKILFAILLPFFMTLVFTSIAKSNKKANKKMTDERFTMFFPRFYLAIGVMGAVVVLLLWIAFEFLQEEP